MKIRSLACLAAFGLTLGLTTGCIDDGSSNNGDPNDPDTCAELSGAQVQGGITLNGSCYVITGNMINVSSGEVVIEPGTTVFFENNGGFNFTGDGRLTAIGTEDEPIVLRGREAIRGYWRALRFDDTVLASRMEWVTVMHAGREAPATAPGSGAVVVQDGVSLSIVDSAFIENGAAGINTVRSTSRQLDFSRIEFTDNEFAVLVNPSHLGSVENLTIEGNDVDAIVIPPAAAPAPYYVYNDATWKAHNVPIEFRHGVQLEADIVIEPGAEMRFRPTAGIAVREGGSLRADAEGADPIRFLGTEERQGGWRGIHVGTDRNSNRFVNVEIRHGGNYQWFAGRPFSQGNIYIDDDSTVFVSDSTLADSEVHAIARWRNGVVNGCENMTYENNAGGDFPDGADDLC